MATQYDHYRILRHEYSWVEREALPVVFETDAFTRHDRFRLDSTWRRVDKVDAIVDVAGLAGDAALRLGGLYGAPIWLASEALELGTVGRTWDQLEVAALNTDLGSDDAVAWWGAARAVGEPILDAAVDAGRLHPNWGAVFSLASLGMNGAQAWYYGP